MDDGLHQTTLATVGLLESRLLRLEHLLYGPAALRAPAPALELRRREPVAARMAHLERRFSTLLGHVRVYGQLVQIYKTHPDLFHAPAPSEPPSQLSTDAIRSIVVASASSYPAVLSSLTAVKDCPIPDVADSAALVSMTGRMRAIQATQSAQAADMAELRRRSETAIRSWYEGGLLADSRFLADVESRIEGVERQVRRRERARDDKEI